MLFVCSEFLTKKSSPFAFVRPDQDHCILKHHHVELREETASSRHYKYNNFSAGELQTLCIRNLQSACLLSACGKTFGARRELCFFMLLLMDLNAGRLNYDSLSAGRLNCDFNRRRADF